MQITKPRRVYDTLVVGSGASGSWVAKELTEKGMSVLMLEASPPRVPARDFTEHVWPYQLQFRGFGDQESMLKTQPVQWTHSWACDEYARHLFVNDHENPYTFPHDKPFIWIRSRQVGGKTYCWARESYRFSDYEFKAASYDGYGEDWPIGYKDLEPYYDKVELFIGVCGSVEGLEQFPDGKYLPPMKLSCGGVIAKKVLEKEFGWRVMPDRMANITVPLNGRPACHYCDQCHRGCFTASYFNSPGVTLPAAFRTGRLRLVSDAVVSHLVMNDEGKAAGVHYVERTTRAHREAYAKVVVLAASALESTRILLNSKSRRFPSGVGGSSGGLGHYVMDHLTVDGGGFIVSLKSSERQPVGNPAGFLIPKYVNVGTRRNKNFLRGYRYTGDGGQVLYSHAFSTPGFGREFRRKVHEEIPYHFGVQPQGERLPRFDNYVTLDPVKNDAWGIPVLHIHASDGENEMAMARAMREELWRIFEAMKLENPWVQMDTVSPFGGHVHECGTARMGNDPKKSVLNRFNQVHDAQNVFVTDGACFVSQGCYEPTLTIMAISARAADYIAEEFRKGNL